MGYFNGIADKFKGFNPEVRGTGFVQGGKIGYNLGIKGGLPFILLGGTAAAVMAPRGHKLSQGLAGTVGFGATTVVSSIIGTMLGGPIGGYAAGLILPMLVGDTVDKAIAGVVQPLVDFGSNMRRARFGGDYRDTQIAMTMRQVGAREMSRSLMNARQWLGFEAAFLHQ